MIMKGASQLVRWLVFNFAFRVHGARANLDAYRLPPRALITR